MRAMAMERLLRREYMPQVITPTCLSPCQRVSPASAGRTPSSSTPVILKRSWPRSRKCSSAPRKSRLSGETVKSRPISHRVSPAFWSAKGYICELS
ncbi:hypothetical protein D3C80_2001220 [compost metagenome]